MLGRTKNPPQWLGFGTSVDSSAYFCKARAALNNREGKEGSVDCKLCRVGYETKHIAENPVALPEDVATFCPFESFPLLYCRDAQLVYLDFQPSAGDGGKAVSLMERRAISSTYCFQLSCPVFYFLATSLDNLRLRADNGAHLGAARPAVEIFC